MDWLETLVAIVFGKKVRKGKSHPHLQLHLHLSVAIHRASLIRRGPLNWVLAHLVGRGSFVIVSVRAGDRDQFPEKSRRGYLVSGRSRVKMCAESTAQLPRDQR